MKPVPACTIASNNYLGLACVFAESYRAHHPGSEVFVCIVDAPTPAIRPSTLPFTPIFAEELRIPAFPSVAFRYDQLELATAVKPFFLQHLRDLFGCERIFYFDPDIAVFDSLQDLQERLDESSVLLTPHITQPLDDNDRLPSELSIRRSGIFNLGFLGLRLDSSTERFLRWWSDRLLRFCVSDPANGLFVDQSWMDFAPAFLGDLGVVRSPRHNVAYWNLAQRDLRRCGDRWTVDGQPLGFFHFSGIDFDRLDLLSRHQNRFTLAERPELRPLFEGYRSATLEAGRAAFADIPYAFGRFRGDEGLAIPAVSRRLLHRVDPDGRRWSDPFESCGDDAYLGWLVEPLAFPNGTLHRLALALWEDRLDLVDHFPDVCGEHLAAFVDWLRRDGGAAAAGMDERLLGGVSAGRPAISSTNGTSTGFSHTPFVATLARRPTALLERLDLQNPGPLLSWLNEPLETRSYPLLTHLALLLHEARGDLQQAYPDPRGEHRREYAYWFVHHAYREYRLHVELVRSVALSLLEPIDLAAPGPWTEWLNHRLDEADTTLPPLTRLSILLLRSHPSLQAQFQDPLGPDRVPYVRWLWSHGKERFGLHSDLLPPLPEAERDAAGLRPRLGLLRSRKRRPQRDLRTAASEDNSGGPASLPTVVITKARERRGPSSRRGGASGVNLLGSLTRPTGIAQVARGSIEVLRRLAIPWAEFPLDDFTLGKGIRGRVHNPAGAPYSLSLVHSNADQIGTSMGLLPAAIAQEYSIGYWFWELSHLPLRFARSFSYVDEVWAPSRFCAESFRSLATVPVRTVPPCVPRLLSSPPNRQALGLDPDRFYFSFLFNTTSIVERKNPLAAVEAVSRVARRVDRPVGLILKATDADRGKEDAMAPVYRAAREPWVHFVSRPTSRSETEALLAASDAYLSLHRSEGLGLPLIESLYLGKPVLATDYGGSTDFLDESTGYPIRFKLTSLERSLPPYPQGAVWAEPDIDHAVEQMVRLLENPTDANRRAAAGRRRVEGLYSEEAAAMRFARELARVGFADSAVPA